MTGCQWRSDWHTRERPVSASPRQKGRQNNNQEGGERNTEREGGGGGIVRRILHDVLPETWPHWQYHCLFQEDRQHDQLSPTQDAREGTSKCIWLLPIHLYDITYCSVLVVERLGEHLFQAIHLIICQITLNVYREGVYRRATLIHTWSRTHSTTHPPLPAEVLPSPSLSLSSSSLSTATSSLFTAP